MARLLPAPETRLPPTPASRFLALCGGLTLVPGTIHVFLPDGGAGLIAGIDLAQGGDRIIGLFA